LPLAFFDGLYYNEGMTFGQPTPTAKRLIQKRGCLCEVEGCFNLATEAHHCLYGRKRGKKHPIPQLDMDENLQLVCERCHHVTGKAKSHQNKVHFWHVQCERYGHQHMVDWHNSLPIKIKEKAYR